MASPAPRLVLLCDVCNEPLTGVGDFLQVNEVAAMDYAQALEEWENRHRTVEGIVSYDLMDRSDPPPKKVRWEVYHKDCDPNPDDQGYWIGAERCTNLAELVGWTAHLMEKSWIANTDWHRRLRRFLEDSGFGEAISA